MAAQSHTPFWRHDHISPTVTSAASFGDSLGASTTVAPPTRNSLSEGGPDAQPFGPGEPTLGYVFGYETQDFAGGSLLDSSENELMKTFFDDPNNFTQYDFGMDQKHNPLSNLNNMDSQSETSPHAFNLNYLPTSAIAPSYNGNNDPQAQPPAHRGADVSAASSLMNMSSQHQSPNVPNGPAWPNIQPSAPGVMVPADESNHDMASSNRHPHSANPYARPMAFTPDLLSARLGVPAESLDPSSSVAPQPIYGHMTNLSYQNYLGPPHPADSLTQIAVTARQHPFSFGSDQDFSSQGYQGMGSSLQREKVYNLLNLPLASQAAGHDSRYPHNPYSGQSSGPSSPGPRQHGHLASATGIEIPTLSQWEASKRRQSHYTGGEDEDGGEDSKRARKRRKSNDGDASRISRSGMDGDSTTPVQRGHGSPPGSPGSSPGAEGSSQRRKTRTNLTESQKRENHIMSEQKRRNVIKQAFNDLNLMVPNLQKGKSGLSKAEILKEVVSYIEATVQGNKCMEELLKNGDGVKAPPDTF